MTTQTMLEVVEKKRARLEELAQNDLGKRFLHHTVTGMPQSLRCSIPYTILKYGLLTGNDRASHQDTRFNAPNMWCGEGSPVFLMDDLHNSFRVDSHGMQMMDVIVDPEILKTKKHYVTTPDSLGILDCYDDEIGIQESIEPEHILGVIVSTSGHNPLYELQKKPQDLTQLESMDKARYDSFNGKSLKGTIMDRPEEGWPANGANESWNGFYRGLAWGMKDFPQNAFPVFTGFSGDFLPYLSGAMNHWTKKIQPDDEIPFELYLARQIFPLTPEAYMQHVFADMAEKRGISSRDVGLMIRGTKEAIRRMTHSQPGVYESPVAPDQEALARRFEKGNVYERRRILQGQI
jgi:hypothetical protein